MKVNTNDRGTLGRAGCQPPGSRLGGALSLPKRTLGAGQYRHAIFELARVVGRLPTTTGWQPVLPNHPIAL